MSMHGRHGQDEQEARLQAQAEQAERAGLAPGEDPGVDRYRLVFRALRQPLLHELPADFAARVLLRIAHTEERSSVEDWLVTGLLLVLAIVGLMAVQPFLGAIVGRFSLSLPALPWPLLIGSALTMSAAWCIDRLLAERAPRSA